MDAELSARIAALMQCLPSSSSTQTQTPPQAAMQNSVAQQNAALQELLGMPTLPATAQMMLDAAKKQAEAAYAHAMQSWENAQQAALQAQATQLLSEQLVREMLMKQIVEANRSRQKDEQATSKSSPGDVRSKDEAPQAQGCKRPRKETGIDDPEIVQHNCQEKKTDEARKAFEKQRKKDDEDTTRREQARAREQAEGQILARNKGDPPEAEPGKTLKISNRD